MKRLILFLIFPLLLCGCAGISPDETVKNALSAPVKLCVECGGARMEALYSDESRYIVFTAPEELAGLKLEFDGRESGAVCGEYSLRCEKGDFPVFDCLEAALDAVNGRGVPTSERAGICEYALDENDIMVYYDEETGLVTEIITKGAAGRFEYRVLSAEKYGRESGGDDRP